MRLGVNRGTQTTSNVSRAGLQRPPRTPVTARNSVSMTLRKSRGAKRSVGVDDVGLAPADELLAERRCVNGPRVIVAVSRRTDTRGPLHAAVGEVDAPAIVDLIVGVRAQRRTPPANCSHGAGLTNTSSRSEQIADRVRGIVRAPPAGTR